jgi:Fe-S oxidoreductase
LGVGAELRDHGTPGPVKILTSCPSCLQGLARYQDDVDLDADHIAVEIAKYTLGADWLPTYVRAATQGGVNPP